MNENCDLVYLPQLDFVELGNYSALEKHFDDDNYTLRTYRNTIYQGRERQFQITYPNVRIDFDNGIGNFIILPDKNDKIWYIVMMKQTFKEKIKNLFTRRNYGTNSKEND